jgi:hypothetical protein
MELKNTTPSSLPCMTLSCWISRSPLHLCFCCPCFPLCISVIIPICKTWCWKLKNFL